MTAFCICVLGSAVLIASDVERPQRPGFIAIGDAPSASLSEDEQERMRADMARDMKLIGDVLKDAALVKEKPLPRDEEVEIKRLEGTIRNLVMTRRLISYRQYKEAANRLERVLQLFARTKSVTKRSEGFNFSYSRKAYQQWAIQELLETKRQLDKHRIDFFSLKKPDRAMKHSLYESTLDVFTKSTPLSSTGNRHPYVGYRTKVQLYRMSGQPVAFTDDKWWYEGREEGYLCFHFEYDKTKKRMLLTHVDDEMPPSGLVAEAASRPAEH